MKLLVHPRWGKTGTSAIQEVFFSNRDTILDSFGLLYPQSGANSYDHAHHDLALAVEESNRGNSSNLKLICDNILQEVESHAANTVLISSEVFQNTKYCVTFNSFLEKFDHRQLIFTVRRQSDILNSLCGQIIKDSGTDFVVSPLSVALRNLDYLNIFNSIESFERNFRATEKSKVVSYGHKVCEDFFCAVTGEELCPLSASIENSSIGVHCIFVLQKIKQLMIKNKIGNQSHFEKVCYFFQSLSLEDFEMPLVFFSKEEKQEVDFYFQKSNNLTQESYGIAEFSQFYSDTVTYSKLSRFGLAKLYRFFNDNFPDDEAMHFCDYILKEC